MKIFTTYHLPDGGARNGGGSVLFVYSLFTLNVDGFESEDDESVVESSLSPACNRFSRN